MEFLWQNILNNSSRPDEREMFKEYCSRHLRENLRKLENPHTVQEF